MNVQVRATIEWLKNDSESYIRSPCDMIDLSIILRESNELILLIAPVKKKLIVTVVVFITRFSFL